LLKNPNAAKKNPVRHGNYGQLFAYFVPIMHNKITILTFACLLTLGTHAQMADNPVDFQVVVQTQPKIDIYPNPAVDYLQVQVDFPSAVKIQFELHSIIGNQMIIQVEDLGGGRYRIPVKEFASGYYFLIIKDEGTRFKKAFKFLKD
jgi:hypothetical protein